MDGTKVCKTILMLTVFAGWALFDLMTVHASRADETRPETVIVDPRLLTNPALAALAGRDPLAVKEVLDHLDAIMSGKDSPGLIKKKTRSGAHKATDADRAMIIENPDIQKANEIAPDAVLELLKKIRAGTKGASK